MSSDPKDVTKTRANKRVVVACSAFVASMIGVSYAAVPLYQLFCQVTGYGGTTQRVEQMSDTVLDRTIKVRFDANVASAVCIGTSSRCSAKSSSGSARQFRSPTQPQHVHRGKHRPGDLQRHADGGRRLFQQDPVFLLYRKTN
jgi:hypothetical protein